MPHPAMPLPLGTEDDPPNDIIRTSRGVSSGAMKMTSRSVPFETDAHMKYQIHRMEMEAYGAVVRAFKSQSDSISWDKESLMTELRKELRVSDNEHREILGTINSDESIKAIRQWCAGINAEKWAAANPAGFDPNSMGQASRKKLKSGHLKYQPIAQLSRADISTKACNEQEHDQRGRNTALCSSQMNMGKATVSVPETWPMPSTGKVRGSLVIQTSRLQDLVVPGCDTIRIRATDKIICEVEKVCSGVNPDQIQVAKAKLLLREHERALVEAIGKLNEVPNCDESPDQRQQLYCEDLRRNAYMKPDRPRDSSYKGYMDAHACIDLPGGEYAHRI